MINCTMGSPTCCCHLVSLCWSQQHIFRFWDLFVMLCVNVSFDNQGFKVAMLFNICMYYVFVAPMSQRFIWDLFILNNKNLLLIAYWGLLVTICLDFISQSNTIIGFAIFLVMPCVNNRRKKSFMISIYN
jgi:hypothetical protein